MNTLGTEVLCNFCDEAVAVLFCHDCNMHFCTANGCDDQIHSGRRHKKEAIQGSPTAAPHEEEAPVCEFCELSPSALYCEDCCMYLCTANGCLASVHKNAVGHEITSLFLDDGISEYGQEEEQEGPSELQSQSRTSESASQSGVLSADDNEPELSQLSIRSGERSGDDRTPTSQRSEPPVREPPKPPPSSALPKIIASDLPRSFGASRTSPVKLATRTIGSASPVPKSAPSTATKIVSNVVKKIVGPIKGTGTKEERLQRKETILAARSEPVKLPSNTFGSKFAPDDVKGRRKPSLSFLKQPATRPTSTSSPALPSSISRPPAPAPRTPSPAEGKRGGDIVITSVTTIRTTTTIRAEGVPPKPKPQTPVTTRARSMSNSSVSSQSSARGSDLPPTVSRAVSDKHASPAASLPSSLFSPSSALPSPTASSVRVTPVRRASVASSTGGDRPNPSPSSRVSSASSSAAAAASSGSASAVHSRRASTIQSPVLSSQLSSTAEADFEYPLGLAPLGLKYVNAPEAGILIRAVTPGEAGDKAGIQVGDIVKLLNRKAVRNMGEFQSILSDCKPAVPYKIAVVRKDKSVDLRMTL